MLKLSMIEKSFGDKKVLSEATLHVKKGDCVMLFGMSGCGKTTLLRIAAGLEKQDKGTVEKNGRVAVVFAEPRLFSTVTVLENVTAVMPRRDKREAKKKARMILESFGLGDAEELYPSELSTGMAARVSLARAVAYDADIYLMDEPFKSLDPEIKQSIVSHLTKFLSDKAVMIISHDRAEAEMMNAEVYQMENGILSKTKNA
jgi:ABC-type nitrate/sulfonate/bicarbonate transport system ATPase subunit